MGTVPGRRGICGDFCGRGERNADAFSARKPLRLSSTVSFTLPEADARRRPAIRFTRCWNRYSESRHESEGRNRDYLHDDKLYRHRLFSIAAIHGLCESDLLKNGQF